MFRGIVTKHAQTALFAMGATGVGLVRAIRVGRRKRCGGWYFGIRGVVLSVVAVWRFSVAIEC